MQDSFKGTPKLKRIRRVTRVGTSDTKNTLDTTLLDCTMTSKNEARSNKEKLMNDTMQTQEQKKKIATSRQSMKSSQSMPDLHKTLDIESKDLELSLLYDEYLQSWLVHFMIKKKTEEKMHSLVAQLATVTQESDQDMEKLTKIKTREQDIKNLSLAQTKADIQLAAITKCTKSETFKTVKNMLSTLQSLLEPLDVLCCNNIILPKTPQQWKETEQVLKQCSKILEDITDLIGPKGNMYCTVNEELKTFSETYSEIEDIQKKLLEALGNLQIRVLKNASLIIENESQ